MHKWVQTSECFRSLLFKRISRNKKRLIDPTKSGHPRSDNLRRLLISSITAGGGNLTIDDCQIAFWNRDQQVQLTLTMPKGEGG